MTLTIFYDGKCPLCIAEMRQLKAYDNGCKLNLVNIHEDDFNDQFPHIDVKKANRILHGQLDSGELLLGLDVTHRAWSLVGKHKWLTILRWPVIRIIADTVYLLFARYRNRISQLLMGKSNCASCLLDISHNKQANERKNHHEQIPSEKNTGEYN